MLLGCMTTLQISATPAIPTEVDDSIKIDEVVVTGTRNATDVRQKEAATLAELEKYRTESRINSYKTRLMESGYDLDTATTMAAELPEGISDDFFAKQKAFIESQKKTIEAELLNKQPGLSKGAALKQTDIDEAEMQKFRAAFGLK